jgi:5-methylcytosine-specific restriction endonuclease McrA
MGSGTERLSRTYSLDTATWRRGDAALPIYRASDAGWYGAVPTPDGHRWGLVDVRWMCAVYASDRQGYDSQDDALSAAAVLWESGRYQPFDWWSQAYGRYRGTNWWKRRRELAATQADYCCQRCGQHRDLTAERKLEVHHITYANLGCEPDGDLRVLCRDCHSREEHLEHPSSYVPIWLGLQRWEAIQGRSLWYYSHDASADLWHVHLATDARGSISRNGLCGHYSAEPLQPHQISQELRRPVCEHCQKLVESGSRIGPWLAR